MVHIPTGVSVFCQDGRSQHKNKEKAFQIIRSKIYAMEEEKRARER
jgi:protein subunit release factor A